MESERNEERRSSNTVLLTIIGIATLLVAIVGATFAFFTAQVTDGDRGSSIVIQTATLKIVYRDGNDIKVDGIVPGWTATKRIEIENESTYPSAVTLRWKTGVINTLADKSELVYSITCTGNGAPAPQTDVEAPGTVTGTTAPIDIFNTLVVPGSALIQCDIVFVFTEISSEQNYNQGKIFSGTLEMVAEAMSADVTSTP